MNGGKRIRNIFFSFLRPLGHEKQASRVTFSTGFVVWRFPVNARCSSIVYTRSRGPPLCGGYEMALVTLTMKFGLAETVFVRILTTVPSICDFRFLLYFRNNEPLGIIIFSFYSVDFIFFKTSGRTSRKLDCRTELILNVYLIPTVRVRVTQVKYMYNI